MTPKNLINTEYATALKEALVMRRNNTIPRAIDDQLGNIAFSIAKWAIGDSLSKNKLWVSQASDEDFAYEICYQVIRYFDRVSLEREPKEILVYLKRVAKSAIRDSIKKVNRAKRKHEEIDIQMSMVTTDFYGNQTSAIALDYDFKQ